jgi:ureidoglycolate lyase
LGLLQQHTNNMPQHISGAPLRTLKVEELNAVAFAQFGTVIELHDDGTSSTGNIHGVSANQGSATKYADVSPLNDMYTGSSNPSDARPVVSLFHCYPRSSCITADTHEIIALDILERHPYTTQMFVPIGLNKLDRTTAFIVVVAPVGTEGPDIEHTRAFKCHGAQAITYGVGIWHAPMIVAGKRPISFVVTQFSNGVAKDDCEEVTIPELSIIHIHDLQPQL